MPLVSKLPAPAYPPVSVSLPKAVYFVSALYIAISDLYCVILRRLIQEVDLLNSIQADTNLTP